MSRRRQLGEPAAIRPATVRRIRDGIDARVRHLLTGLLPGAAQPSQR